MVNYDIPWNPNRLEQRFGRIHRIGQRHICHLWNLVAVDTREGDVFQTLLDKLEVQREALGDQVFDVLGQVLTDTSLSQLLEAGAQRGGGPRRDRIGARHGVRTPEIGGSEACGVGEHADARGTCRAPS